MVIIILGSISKVSGVIMQITADESLLENMLHLCMATRLARFQLARLPGYIENFSRTADL